MRDLPESLRSVDWRLTTWEGARREQLRRWAELPLDRVIESLEEMSTLAQRFGAVRGDDDRAPPSTRERDLRST